MEQLIETIHWHPVAEQVEHHAWVEVTGSGAHDQPLQRRVPIEVSTERPRWTALAEQPFPRCKEIIVGLGTPASSAYRSVT